MIVINPKNNKPSVPRTDGKLESIDCVNAFIDGGCSIAETMEELHLSKEAVEVAIKAKRSEK